MKSQPKQLQGCRHADKSEATDPAVRASPPAVNLLTLCKALWTSMEPTASLASSPLDLVCGGKVDPPLW